MQIQVSGIYWLTTNAPADKEPVVTKDGHRYMDRKFRPSVVLEKLHQTKDKENIYLVAQFCSKKPDPKENIPSVEVDDYLSNHENLELHGFVIPINVRMALESEFEHNPVNKENDIELVPEDKFIDFREKCYELIRGIKRQTVINDVVNKNFDNFSEKEWIELIDFTQFNQPEREVKGFYGAYNDKRNKR